MPTYRVEHPGSQFPYSDRFVLDTDDEAVANRVGTEMPGSVMTEDTVQTPKAIEKLPGVSRLVCLDVGGVLANKDTSDDYSHLEPLEGCKEFLETLREHKVGTVVNSAHPVDEVTAWLKQYGLLDLISGGAQLGDQRLPPVVSDKPRAEKYIDDRMVRYKGDYEEALDAILDFEPWWSKDYDVDSVALDFDGTLNVYGMAGTDDEITNEPPAPQEGAQEFVAKLYSKVGRVVIFSCRPPAQIEAWLTKWKFDRHIDAVEDHKPKVKVYLDDRGMRFKGKYDKILDKLRLLEPVEQKGTAGGVLGVNLPPGNSTATPRVYGEPQTKEAKEVSCPDCDGRGTALGSADNCRTCLGKGKVVVADDKRQKTIPGEKLDQPAAIAIVLNKDGKVLTVTRPDSPEQSLPGGLVDAGENAEQAAVREVMEETGVKVSNLDYLGDIKSPTDGRKVSVFKTTEFEGAGSDVEDAGKVEWMTPWDLAKQSQKYSESVRQLLPHMKAPVQAYPNLPPAEEFGERAPETAKPPLYANGFASVGDDVGVEKSLTTSVRSAFNHAAAKEDEDTKGGLRVWVNEAEKKVVIDILDWGDEDLGKGIGRTASESGGFVKYQDEGGNPEGDGWEELKYERQKSAEVQPTEPELMGDRFGNAPWNLAAAGDLADTMRPQVRANGTAEGVQPADLSHEPRGPDYSDEPVLAQSISKVGPEGSGVLFSTPDQMVAGIVEGTDRDTAKVRVTSIDKPGRFSVGDTVLVPGIPDDRTELKSGPQGPGPALLRFSDDPTITRDIKASYREGYAAAQAGERAEDNPYIVGEPYKSAGWTAGWQDGNTGSDPQVKDKDGELYPPPDSYHPTPEPNSIVVRTSPYSTERREDGWWTLGPVGTWNEHGPFDSWEQADHAADRLMQKGTWDQDEYPMPDGSTFDMRMGKADDGTMERAKAADLIVLPPDVQGTNCGNCEYMDGGECKHPKVQQPVEPRWCCIYWDASGTQRVADQEQDKGGGTIMPEGITTEGIAHVGGVA